jgi:hypothetical protein
MLVSISSNSSDELNDTTYSNFQRYPSLKHSFIYGDEQEMRRLGYLGNKSLGENMRVYAS